MTSTSLIAMKLFLHMICAHNYQRGNSLLNVHGSNPAPGPRSRSAGGLGPSAKAALALLCNVKALKNVSDLNLFIRDNMLDIPAAFDDWPRR